MNLFFALPLLLAGFSGFVPVFAATPRAAVDGLVAGLHTRVVWVRGGDRLMGGGALTGYDSRLDRFSTLVPREVNLSRPVLCSGGNQVVFSVDYQVYVVNWDGTGLRRVTQGIGSSVWIHPVTGRQWVVVRKGDDSNEGAVYRHDLFDPQDSLLLWDRGPAGDHYVNWWAISEDGLLAVDHLPWNRCFVIEGGGMHSNGAATGLTYGCWSSLASDNSYIWFNYPAEQDGHETIDVFRGYEPIVTGLPVAVFPLPQGASAETFHPRFASRGGRFLTVSAGYRGDDHAGVGIYLGRFASDYRSFSGWVRICDGVDSADYYGDAWVGVEDPMPQLLLDHDSIQVVREGSSGECVLPSNFAGTLHGSLEGVTVGSSAPWITVNVREENERWVLEHTVDCSDLDYGRYTARVTVSSVNAGSREYQVCVVVTGRAVLSAIKLEPRRLTMNSGDSHRFTVTFLDQQLVPMDTSLPVVWTLSTTNGGTLDAEGFLRAGDASGAATVSVSFDTLVDSTQVLIRGPDERLLQFAADLPDSVVEGARYPVAWEHHPAVSWFMLHVSPDGGSTWIPLWPAARSKWATKGSYHWFVMRTIVDSLGVGHSLLDGTVLLRISDALDPSVYDVRSRPLTILQAVTLTPFPPGTIIDTWSSVTVHWTADPRVLGVSLQVSPDDGENWYALLSRSIGNRDVGWGAWPWVVPPVITGRDGEPVALVSDRVLLRVRNYTHTWMQDEMSHPFEIRRSTELYPLVEPVTIDGSDTVFVGDTVSLVWVADTARVSYTWLRYRFGGASSWRRGVMASPCAGEQLCTLKVMVGDFLPEGDSRALLHMGVSPDSVDTVHVASRVLTVFPAPLTIALPDSTVLLRWGDSIRIRWELHPRAVPRSLTLSLVSGDSAQELCHIDARHEGLASSDSMYLVDEHWYGVTGWYRLRLSDRAGRFTACTDSFYAVAHGVVLPPTQNQDLLEENREGCGGCGTGVALSLLPAIGLGVGTTLRRRKQFRCSRRCGVRRVTTR